MSIASKHRISMTALALVLTSQAQAGGLWLNEYNSWAMGRAGAGRAAGTGDAASVLHNPAAMVELDRSELVLGAGYISPTTEFDLDRGSVVNGTGDGGSAGEGAPSLSAFYVRPVNDKWTMGVAMVALSGAGLDYADDWAGRFQAQEVELLVIGLTPGVSYKVNDKLSLGFGGALMYSSLDLTIGVPNSSEPVTGPEGSAEVDGDDFQMSPRFGFLYRFNDRTSIGADYLGSLDFEYDGDANLQPIGLEVGIQTDVTFAEMIRVGLRHQINEQWRGHLSWGWDNWSEMSDVVLSTSSGGVALPRNWEDTYHYAAGLEYVINDSWTVQGGVAYDTDPTRARDRTADMPVDEQIRYAFGVKRRLANGMDVSGLFTYADYGDGEIDSARLPPLVGYQGEYKDNDIVFFSLSLTWPLGARR